jgi:membrane protein required for beta-lactamase induction
MNRRMIVIAAFLLWALASGCTVDPRKTAAAYETTVRADQDAADRTQERQIEADLHAIAMADAQAAEAERQAAQQVVWRNLGYSLVMLLWLSSIGLAAGIAYASVGTGRAVAHKAMIQANLIRLDPTTRQFPLLLQYTGKGKVSLTNPNTGQVLLLDTRSQAHRQMIQGSAAVQLAGVLAREASRSDNPEGVAMVTPVLTEYANDME